MTQHGTMDRLVQTSLDTGIRRPQQGRWVAGVAAGLGASRGIDPVLFRVGFILLTLLGGIGITAYLLCWLLLPSEDGTVPLDRAMRRGDGGAITLLVITAISLFGMIGAAFGENSRGLVGLVLLGGLVFFIVRRGRRIAPATSASSGGAAATPATTSTVSSNSTSSTEPTPPLTAPSDELSLLDPAVRPAPASLRAPSHGSTPPPVPSPAQSRPVAAPTRPRPPQIPFLLTLVVAGLAVIAYPAGTTLGSGLERPWLAGLAAMTVVVGVACIVAGLAKRRAAILEAASWIMALSLLLSATAVTNTAGIGDHHWQPRNGVELSTSYSAGIGDATLDLTHLPASDLADAEISVSGGIGDLTVVLPDDVRTTVVPDLGIGSFTVTDRTSSNSTGGVGVDHDPVTVGSGPHHLTVRIDAGIGDVKIETRPRTALTEGAGQ
ncbi:MAG: PspC domain-containing protein [Mobilicoccus sp.]|nr:PspC domain-containing protein [Mobilicoccus sp.]